MSKGGTMRYEVSLVGPGHMTREFERHLDHLCGAVIVGDTHGGVTTLSFDVYAMSRPEARATAALVAEPIIEVATSEGVHLALIVSRAEGDWWFSRWLQRRAAARVVVE